MRPQMQFIPAPDGAPIESSHECSEWKISVRCARQQGLRSVLIPRYSPARPFSIASLPYAN